MFLVSTHKNRPYLIGILILILVTTLNWRSTETAAGKSPADEQDYLTNSPEWSMPDHFMKPIIKDGDMGWPSVRPEAKPGAYWWWPGSAVNKKDLTWNLEVYQKAGWGNLGVIGIYGVKGEEDHFIDIFSSEWFGMYNHAVNEAKRLEMNIDLTPSSGWRLGGPHVSGQHAEQSFSVKDGRIEVNVRSDKVKRAGPGGEGLCINPYSPAAVDFHFNWLAQKFEEGHGISPRAFYYDSFENPGNWCPELLDSFRRFRGYDLEAHAEALGGIGETDYVRRVMCDYRETLSDLLIDCVEQIVEWSEKRGSGLRMQAHGAPANLIDMYAAARYPETEVFGASNFDIPGYRRDPEWCRPDQQSILVNRFASSAAHVAGRNLVISESFTWLRNHYHTALSHIKAESDNLLLNGINGIYYHGICFAPENTAWPGWLFYASTQANYRNSIFRDIPVLNAYITRCQSVLQNGRPHNDVLLYWPVYDLWMGGGDKELRFSVHLEWIDDTECGKAGDWMIRNGYTFDFVSDKYLKETNFKEGSLITKGANTYQTILLPAAKFMQANTLRHLIEQAKKGATILVWKQLPDDVPGWFEHISRKKQLMTLIKELSFDSNGLALIGRGKIIIDDDLGNLLKIAGIVREQMADSGLGFIRRKHEWGVKYFVSNQSGSRTDGWIGLGSPFASAVIMDPMNGHTGIASIREKTGRKEIYLQLEPGETRIIRAFSDKKIAGDDWPVLDPIYEPVPVRGTWSVRFVEGGPVLPDPFTTDTLKCWTELGDDQSSRFAGAASYTASVDLPDINADHWFLDLGDVRESARVWVNNQPAGVLVAHPFRLDITGCIKPGQNDLTIEVTNLSANRIRYLDLRGIEWKKFYDINIVNQMYEPFDASKWELKPSGLLGPVKLIPYQYNCKVNHWTR